MIKYTQKQLRQMVREKIAVDITQGDNATREKIEQVEEWLTQIGYSVGTYGVNGKLLQGHKTGTLYAITTRSSAIFIF